MAAGVVRVTQMRASAKYRLSKSRFVCGLQCHRQLWWKVHEPDAPELTPDPAQQAIFDRGHLVGERARSYVAGGVLIEFPRERLSRAIEETRRAVEQHARAIYEAAFSADDVYVAVDILERRSRAWTLIEVKSSTKVKPAHLPDAAIQTHVLRTAGLRVKRVEIMRLNRECRFPDLSNLFVRDDVTSEVDELLPEIPGQIRAQLAMLSGKLPPIPDGYPCEDPYECPFLQRCWPELPRYHISTLYRGGKLARDLEAAGIETIDAIPADAPLNAVQARQHAAVLRGEIVVDAGLSQALACLARPIAFLDFETVNPAIPVWNGCRPYDAVPVQFSVHVEADGELAHREFLADGPADPRAQLAHKLVAACSGAATVLAYNASFERTCIDGLIAAVPRLRAKLTHLRERIDDLLPLVRNHVYHPDFGGSFSIKSVLPALVPELGYDDLEVADGQTASADLEALLFSGEAMAPAARQKMRRALLEYCRRDTEAMVRVLERLRELAGATGAKAGSRKPRRRTRARPR